MPTHVTVPTPDRSDEELTPPPDGAAMLMVMAVPAPVSVPVAGVKDTTATAAADTRPAVSGSAAVPTGISPEPVPLPASLKGDEPTPTDAMPTHVTASTPDGSDEELTPLPDGAAMLMMMAVPAPVSVPVAGVKDTIVPAAADTRPAVSGDRVTTSTATASTTLSPWGDVATTAEADAGASTTSPLQQDSQDSWRPTSAAESFAVSPPPVLMAAVAGEGVTVSPALSPEAFAPSVPPEVQTPVGDPGWPDELGGTLSLMLDKTLQNAEIRLNPQHLGPLQVSIRMENDQVAIQFSSEQAAVREALEAAAPRLRDLLAGQQLTVADVSVNTPEPQPRPDGGNAFAGFERQSRSPYPQQERFGQVDNTRGDDPEPTRIQVPVPGLPNQSISFYA
jgi:flagellar hook-length control protein FliK